MAVIPGLKYFRRGSAASLMQASELNADHCAASRHLHLTGIYVGVSPTTRDLVFELAARARQQGQTISFDPNLRPSVAQHRRDGGLPEPVGGLQRSRDARPGRGSDPDRVR